MSFLLYSFTTLLYIIVHILCVCNMQCSVTCGTGEQMRDVVCVGSRGNQLEDHMCGTLLKPPRTQACEMSPCRTSVGWHVGDWGLVRKALCSSLSVHFIRYTHFVHPLMGLFMSSSCLGVELQTVDRTSHQFSSLNDKVVKN